MLVGLKLAGFPRLTSPARAKLPPRSIKVLAIWRPSMKIAQSRS